MSTYAAPPQQEREQEQVIGTITGLLHKGEDKYQVVVQPDGSQYTKNLWTKDASVVQYCNSQIGNRLAFLCNASHWTNAQQQPVRSLWIEAVGPPEVGSPALAGPSQPVMQQTAPPPAQAPIPVTAPPQQSAVVQPQVTPMMVPQQVTPDVKEQRIHRQTATKVAAILLSHMNPDERNLASLFVVSERLVAYYNDGLPSAETIEQLMGRAMPRSMDETPPSAPVGDDDIPF